MALPEELKTKILGYLSYSDLKSVVLVSRQWRRMGEQPFLWRHFTLLVRTEVSLFSGHCSTHRFRLLNAIDFLQK